MELDRFAVEFDGGSGVLEVEAVGDFAARLIDGIAHLLLVDLRDDIECRHPATLLLGPSGSVPEWPKGADCKSAGERLRWFESSPAHVTPGAPPPARFARSPWPPGSLAVGSRGLTLQLGSIGEADEMGHAIDVDS